MTWLMSLLFVLAAYGASRIILDACRVWFAWRTHKAPLPTLSELKRNTL